MLNIMFYNFIISKTIYAKKNVIIDQLATFMMNFEIKFYGMSLYWLIFDNLFIGY